MNEEEGNEKGTKGRFGESLEMPAKFAIEDFLKVIEILNQKGQKATKKDIVEIFGKTTTEQELARRAIRLHTEFQFIEGERNISMTKEGIGFITADEQDKKKILREKISAYPKYKDIIIRLGSVKEKALKKSDITNFLSRGGGGIAIRKAMTKTFSSLGGWVGLLEDTGKSVKLIEINEIENNGSDFEVPQNIDDNAKQDLKENIVNAGIANSSLLKSQNPSVQIKVDPSLDPEKLEKQLTILRKFGLI